ncbi:MAG: MFS transporter [Candidatus Omnitrophota bacterium]
MFSSLKVRNFRIYWFGTLVSLTGTWIQAVAQSWLVFELTKSAFLLGVVGFLTYIPIFLLSLFGGVLADRVNKRNILIFTQIAFMLLAFILALLTQLKLITPAQIMVIALLNGVVMAFDAPSRQAVVVELVGKTHLLNAIALNSAAFNSARIIGPALAGVFVSTVGMSGCFYINGVSFLAVIAALFLIKIKNNVRNNRNNRVWQDLRQGLGFIKNHRPILLLMAMVGMVSLFGVSYIILMPVFASEVLKVGVRGLGILMSSAGAGALAGALLLARLGDFRRKGRFLISSSLVFSVSLVLFSLSRNYLSAVFFLALVGGAGVIAVALVNTMLQVNVSDEIRGRVMSVFMLTFAGIMPFGNLIAGGLTQVLGVSFAICISGIICTVFFLTVSRLSPALWDGP